MKAKNLLQMLTVSLFASTAFMGCSSNSGGNGFTKIDYEQVERERYDNIFRDNIPDQWPNYGIGDPFLLRYNGEYYLFVSTKDNNPGYRVWKSRDLVRYEYLGQKGIYNADGTTTGQLGQYAPEIYYWNGDFYMIGSPSGHGHFIYKSDDRTPFGNYRALTSNFGLSIDGSVFIDDDESMYFLVAASGGINSYKMNSISSVDANSVQMLNSPLVKWTEGPCIVKHNGTYFLTYTGNHVKSKGYRIDYSYSNEGPQVGYNYPANNSIALNTLIGKQVGLGHSSMVLGPNLDSYYMPYHSLDNASGPIRSYNIDRISFSNNRMTLIGPNEFGTQAAMMPDYITYDGEDNYVSKGEGLFSNIKTNSRFTAEYNFKNLDSISNLKLLFNADENGNSEDFITLTDHTISLFVSGTKVKEGEIKNDFDWSVLNTVRLVHEEGHYSVYFNNLKKIDITADKVDGGFIGYKGVNQTQIGSTSFSNDAYDSSEKREAKILPGDFFATSYLKEVSNISESAVNQVEVDDIDFDYIYQDAASVKLSKPGEYITYPLDVMKSSLYGIETLFRQKNAGSRISIQIDNNSPVTLTLPKSDFSTNMNSFENDLQFIKSMIAEVEIEKGLHTIKFELIKGEAEFIYFNMFEDSKYSPDFSHNLSTYVSNGADYLSLWKIFDDNGTKVHKALSGVNNMLLLGNQKMTDYVVEVDIKMTINAAASSQVGLIVRCNNPSLYSGQVDYSAQGYMVTFDRMQLMLNRINYNNITTAVTTGSYSLNEYHHLKVTCKGNLISVNFDGVDYFSYRDPNPYSHGLVTLVSLNCESLFKNLSIKGI